MTRSLTNVVKVADPISGDALGKSLIEMIDVAVNEGPRGSRYAYYALDELASYDEQTPHHMLHHLISDEADIGDLIGLLRSTAPGPCRVVAYVVVFWLIEASWEQVQALYRLAISKGATQQHFIEVMGEDQTEALMREHHRRQVSDEEKTSYEEAALRAQPRRHPYALAASSGKPVVNTGSRCPFAPDPTCHDPSFQNVVDAIEALDVQIGGKACWFCGEYHRER